MVEDVTCKLYDVIFADKCKLRLWKRHKCFGLCVKHNTSMCCSLESVVNLPHRGRDKMNEI